MLVGLRQPCLTQFVSVKSKKVFDVIGQTALLVYCQDALCLCMCVLESLYHSNEISTLRLHLDTHYWIHTGGKLGKYSSTADFCCTSRIHTNSFAQDRGEYVSASYCNAFHATIFYLIKCMDFYPRLLCRGWWRALNYLSRTAERHAQILTIFQSISRVQLGKINTLPLRCCDFLTQTEKYCRVALRCAV